MRLVVAEKPSVARDLAKVLGVRGRGDGCLVGDALVITWCVGHLVELAEPSHYDERWKRWSLDTLPMLPQSFALKARKDGAADQWKAVRDLLRDKRFDAVVNACDAGREGELIFRYAYELAGCKHPVQRLWLSSLTDEAIERGWKGLRDGRLLDPLADAARCRSEADWLVGLNATRALTCLSRAGGGSQMLSIGRVQTPTLAMIVARDRAIEAFVPETFHRVVGTFTAPDGAWQAAWFQEGGQAPERETEDDEAPRAERVAERAHADQIAEAARGREGVVEVSEQKESREPPPLLYDLTSLQRRANQRYGFDAGQTLAIAQALYEKHKLLSYPRTDARHLTPDQVAELPGIVRGLRAVPVYAPFVDDVLSRPITPGRRVVDAAEVGDHHAIIPTGRAPGAAALSVDEKRVFDLVARRFLAALSPDAVLARGVLIVAVPPGGPLPDGITAPLRFRAKGRAVRFAGWRAVDPPPPRKDTFLPAVDVGAVVPADPVDVLDGQTRPPRPHNDATLLKAMETAGKDLDDRELKRAMKGAGLGTPATRANIIKTLIDRNYVTRRQRDLCATPLGCAVIDALPVEELKSAELTGRWEARLTEMAEGREERARFMADIAENVHAIVAAIASAEPPPAEAMPAVASGEPLGACPICHTPVTEGRGAFSCATGRACTFVVFKKMSGRAISRAMVKEVLASGRSKVVKGFKSKQGKAFSAGLLLRADGSVGFHFPEREDADGTRTEARKPPAPATPVGLPCPRCGDGRLIAGRTAWGCDRWRDGCRFTLPFEVDGKRLTDAEAARRVMPGDARS